MTHVDIGDAKPEDLVAPEDMQIIIAVVKNLVEAKKVFRINLPFGAYLTNHEGGPVFSFSGIDQIKEAQQKLHNAVPMGDVEWMLIMPTDTYTERTRIGDLFGMKVYADPECGKNNFVIQERPKPTESP